MSQIKTGVIGVVAVLLVIVVLQNTQSVETKILFVTVAMPRAVLLFVTLLVGFVLGLGVASWFRRNREAGTDV